MNIPATAPALSEMLVKFFGCGYIVKSNSKKPSSAWLFQVKSREQLRKKVVPILKKCEILCGVQSLVLK